MGYLVCVECGTRNWDWGGGIADQKCKKCGTYLYPQMREKFSPKAKSTQSHKKTNIKISKVVMPQQNKY